MDGSVIQSYRRRILANDASVRVYGGESAQWFDYPNGSRIWVAGMDDPGKVLSSERDIIYVNQAEELTLEDWETLTTRATGRAGNIPFAQVIGDCNPGAAHHWIKQRAGLTLLESRHEDNPLLFNPATGAITAQGIQTMIRLDRLTGVRKERLRYGRWVNAEGAVYEFDAALHLVDAFAVPDGWKRYCAIDFGYTNPFVCLWIARDDDGRLYVYRQLYMTQRTVRAHAAQIAKYSEGEQYEATVADHDAEDRATLAECGIETIAARKEISPGIQAVQERLARAGDGKPRLFVMRGGLVEVDEALRERHKPISLEEELDVYVWPKDAAGKALKEAPVKENDHACLIGSTRVATALGDVTIDRVRPGDRVLTRNGYRRVVACGMTAPNAVVHTVMLSDGATLTGTGDHLVYVQGRGFVRLDTLRYGDMIVSNPRPGVSPCRNRKYAESKPLSSMASRFVVILTRAASRTASITCRRFTSASKALADCIRRFGNPLTEPYRQGTKYIMSMATRSTMRLPIWSVGLPASISVITAPSSRPSSERKDANGSTRFARWLRPGIGRMMAERGIANMELQAGKDGSQKRMFVNNVASVSSRAPVTVEPNIAPTNAGRPRGGATEPTTKRELANGAESGSRRTDTGSSAFAPVHVVAVTTNADAQPVYNLTVDAAVGEYFANGILVHNCDALRYMVMYFDGGVEPRPLRSAPNPFFQ